MYREVKKPRTRHIGDRVIGLRYVYPGSFLDRPVFKEFPGTLIKSEYAYGPGTVVTNPRYTVKCDDGKVRRFQVLK